MKQIWKYQLDPQLNTIDAPHGWRPISVDIQRGIPCLWAMIETGRITRSYRVEIVGTGHNCDHVAGLQYVGTFLIEDDSLVFHVFVEV